MQKGSIFPSQILRQANYVDEGHQKGVGVLCGPTTFFFFLEGEGGGGYGLPVGYQTCSKEVPGLSPTLTSLVCFTVAPRPGYK